MSSGVEVCEADIVRFAETWVQPSTRNFETFEGRKRLDVYKFCKGTRNEAEF